MKKSVKMNNSKSSKLDQILNLGKAVGDRSGLGYIGKRSYSKTVFVQATNTFNPQEVKKHKSKRHLMEFGEKNLIRKCIPRCYYCNHLGHIKPQCLTFLEDLRINRG